MRVEFGPVPSSSAIAWIDYAETVLRSGGPEPYSDTDAPTDAVSAFLTYLGEWRRAAEASEAFTWSIELPEEVAEYQVLAFYRIVRRLAEAAETRGQRLAPPEGQEFYLMLVDRLLDALASEGAGASEFAEHLRSFWPGL